MSTTISIVIIPYPQSGSSGGGGGSNNNANGSITNPGQPGQVAQAVQGIPGGVPMPTAEAGSVGADWSANAPAGPGNATSFTFNGVTVNLLQTIAANPSRKSIEINNTTGANVVVVIDDGHNTAGSVGLFPLAPGASANTQGGDLTLTDELGRVRVFGTTGTFCFVREN